MHKRLLNTVIYKLEINNICYVGKTSNIKTRYETHLKILKAGKFKYPQLQQEFNLTGIAPTFTILDSVSKYYNTTLLNGLTLEEDFGDCLEAIQANKENSINQNFNNISSILKYQSVFTLWGMNYIPYAQLEKTNVHQNVYTLPSAARLRVSGGQYKINNKLAYIDPLDAQGLQGKIIYFNNTHLKGQSLLIGNLSNLEIRLIGIPFEAGRRNCSIKQYVLASYGKKLNYKYLPSTFKFPCGKVWGLTKDKYNDQSQFIDWGYINNALIPGTNHKLFI